MFKDVINSLREMPDLSNKYYFWRAIRLAAALAFTGIWSTVFSLEIYQSGAFFSATLYLAITDMSASVENRIKMLLITMLTTIVVGVITITLAKYPLAIYVFILVLVFGSQYLARYLPVKNMYISISLLAFVFALPFNSEKIGVLAFAFYQLMGGLWYLSTVVFGITVFFMLKAIKSRWANYFYLDESYALTADEHFITPKQEVAAIIEEENEGEKNVIFQHPVRLVLSLALGYTYILVFPSVQDYWVLLTIIFVHHPSKKINASIPRIVQRFLGTILGIMLFWPLADAISEKLIWVGLTFLFSVPIFIFIRNNYFIAVTFITLLVLSNIRLIKGINDAILIERGQDTVVGILVVLTSHYIIRAIKIGYIQWRQFSKK